MPLHATRHAARAAQSAPPAARRIARALTVATMLSGIGAACPAAERLILGNSETKTATRFEYMQDTFLTPDGTAIARADVVDWWLAPGTAPAAGQLADRRDAREALATLGEYRRKGDTLAARFPGTSGVILIDDGTYTLTADRRHIYRYHFAGLVRHESRVDWGEVTLGFTEGRSRQRLVLARALAPDGTLHELSPAELRAATPPQDSVHFDPKGRILSGIIPGVEVGSVVETITEYENYQPEDWRLFFPGYYFQTDLPVALSRFVVRMPEGTPLHHWTENWRGADAGSSLVSRLCSRLVRRGQPTRRRRVDDDGASVISYTWSKKDMPPIVSEPNMPPWYEVVPAMHGSVMREWAHLNELIGGMQRERMQATPEIAALVAELTASSESTADRVAKLYHWVQKNIRYISVKSSLSSGWSGHPAAETFAQGYGDCTDKAILFSTMLGCIGVAAEPVVVRTNDRGLFVPRYPVLACNHCIVEVRFDGKRLYLDPTTQDHRYPALRSDNHGVLGYNFITGERRVIPIPPGMEAHGKHARDIMELRADGSLHVQSANHYGGAYEAGLRAGWKRVPEHVRNQVMQQYLNGLAPGARLGAVTMPDPQDLEQPFTLDYTYAIPDYAVQAGTLRMFQFPDRQMAFPEASLEERRYPLVDTTAEALIREATLRIPDGWEVVELPPDMAVSGRHVTYRENFSLTGNTLVYRAEYERHGNRVPVGDYAAHRRILQHIAHQTRKPVYFHVPETSAPPAP